MNSEKINWDWKDEDDYFKNLMESVPPAIDFMLEHCKDARWDIVARAMDILERKFNDDLDR